MKEKPTKYCLNQLYYLFVTAIAVATTYYVCSLFNYSGIVKIIVNGVTCLIIPNIIFLILYFKLKEFSVVKNIVKKVFNKFPQFISSDEIRDLNKSEKIYLKLRKKYKNLISLNLKTNMETSNYIFTCWLQGEENAPDLVKACFKSMRENFKDWELIIITSENLKEYVNFPNFIIEKWKNKIISNTHFSDLLRTELLIKYGGLWLDSTVFCTGSIDRYINQNTDLFVYKNEHRKDATCLLSSWLIYSKSNNPILINTRDILYKYWKNNNFLIDYFLFHKVFTLVCEDYKNIWNKIPFYSNIEPHVLWFHYFYSDFNIDNFNLVKSLSNFHKLSYKFDKDKLCEDNFYNYLLNYLDKK